MTTECDNKYIIGTGGLTIAHKASDVKMSILHL